ncbi:MAG: hypothetical protein ACLU3D_06215 [Acutalibacteraceae bacterium]|uniref:hypothetical protein n=1 Tax=Candidatus Fimivicinus sp. TaxID=3056640 RepID=UPI003A18ECFE
MAVLLARQTTQLSLPESKEDNAATVLKTDVYPCTLMQEYGDYILWMQVLSFVHKPC